MPLSAGDAPYRRVRASITAAVTFGQRETMKIDEIPKGWYDHYLTLQQRAIAVYERVHGDKCWFHGLEAFNVPAGFLWPGSPAVWKIGCKQCGADLIVPANDVELR